MSTQVASRNADAISQSKASVITVAASDWLLRRKYQFKVAFSRKSSL